MLTLLEKAVAAPAVAEVLPWLAGGGGAGGDGVTVEEHLDGAHVAGEVAGLGRLRAGEATSLVLLTATALGLASCPITEPLEIPETRAAVRTDVFGADGCPQMLLRIGWAPVNADPLPSTPRRDLAEVVAQLDGSPLGHLV